MFDLVRCESPIDEQPFTLTDSDREVIEAPGRVRPDQARFRFEVLQRYGVQCSVCGIARKELLDAAHIRPWSEKGADDPRNGLPLCANHHRAMEAGLFGIEPESMAVVMAPGMIDDFGMRRTSLSHMEAVPHTQALRWVWDRLDWTPAPGE